MIKKYHASTGAWTEPPYRLYDTETDGITTFPADILADVSQSNSCKIIGNMSRITTPTSSSPVYPSECGDLVESGEHSGEYILPINCGNTTTNWYTAQPLRKIGDYSDYKSESQEYRVVKKLVFDGSESWNLYATASQRFFYIAISDLGIANKSAICSHSNNATLAQQNRLRIYDNDSTWSDTTEFTQFLANQYNNGTPVCVWYVLAEPTATSVAAPAIPTSQGAQTFNVNTSLKPSKAELTYHGWHPKTPKESEDGSWS